MKINFNQFAFKSIIQFCFIFLICCFGLNCLSPQPTEKQISPNFKSGCSEFKGANRTKCIQDLLSELESLRNPNNKIEKTITETRHDSNWILVETKFCPSENLCWTDYRYEYRPSFWGKARDYLTVGGLGFVLGLFTAFTI